MNNMKGGPLNVMEVVRTSKIQHEWRVNSNKIGTRAMFFCSFCPFWPSPEGDDVWVCPSTARFKQNAAVNALLNSSSWLGGPPPRYR